MPRAVPRPRLAALLALLSIPLALPAAAAAAQGPELRTFAQALPYSLVHPSADPSGANDFSCKPSAAHPRPVILLHGTFSNRFNSFAGMAPALKRAGFCVFAPNYGRTWLPVSGGMRSVRGGADEVAAYVQRVRVATGAAQVDLVGYSQGATVARAYLRWSGGADAADPSRNAVHTLVGVSAVNHGTRLVGLTGVIKALSLDRLIGATLGQGPRDLLDGSPLMRELNAGGETVPGVRYTMIATRTDLVNLPYRDAYLTPTPGSGDEVTNTVVQHGCPTDLSSHFNLTYSLRVQALVARALDPAAAPGRLPCQLLLPGI